MEVAARRIHAERPARPPDGLPRRQPERTAKELADRRRRDLRWRSRRLVQPAVGQRAIERCVRQFHHRSPGIAAERIGLGLPVEIAGGPGKSLEVVFGGLVILQRGRLHGRNRRARTLAGYFDNSLARAFSRFSISLIAWDSCARRTSCVVRSSWRCISVL